MADRRVPDATIPRSVLTGIRWPAVADPPAALALAMQFQFARSERLATTELEACQLAQLEHLLAHAFHTTGFWYERLRLARYWPGMRITRAWLRTIPVLTRAELQTGYDALKSTRVPPEHGQHYSGDTSGSTGTPVRIVSTDVSALIYRSLTLREYRWHARDFHGKLLAIRAAAQTQTFNSWGSGIDTVYDTGPAVVLSPQLGVDTLLTRLVDEDPDYLVTNPSMVRELALETLRTGRRPARLRQVRCVGETLHEDLREIVMQAWEVPVADTYSAVETGYLGLQCPEHVHYHVPAEAVWLEVLDDHGNPCRAGQIGRVVVTPLHNFAMPLIRYEIGDYAEPGEACDCGRTLPVLRRIVGRRRNMCTLPDGRRIWPVFGARQLRALAPVKQFQIIQKTRTLIEARICAARALSAEERAVLAERMSQRLGADPTLEVRIVEVPSIERKPGEKYEDFVSEVSVP